MYLPGVSILSYVCFYFLNKPSGFHWFDLSGKKPKPKPKIYTIFNKFYVKEIKINEVP